jgi:MrfA Zn-binding domain
MVKPEHIGQVEGRISYSYEGIDEVAVDCGYPASALKERIYLLPRLPGQPIQCGILIYTASAGNQGTLGGLVEITHRFAKVLKFALERERLCSGDPVCADHTPARADDDRMLHGAACHGCLLISETSCEARNVLLDRVLLVDTVGPTGAAFF